MPIQDFFEQPKNEKTPCRNVVGSDGAVTAFCDFWARNEKELGILAAVKLYRYTNDHSFTKEELVAFKLGVASIFGFFQDCWIEVNNKPKEEDKEIKK